MHSEECLQMKYSKIRGLDILRLEYQRRLGQIRRCIQMNGSSHTVQLNIPIQHSMESERAFESYKVIQLCFDFFH